MRSMTQKGRRGLPKSVVYVIRLDLLNAALSLALLLLSQPFLRTFTYLLMLEAALLFLVGGSMDLTSSRFIHSVRHYLSHSDEEWSEKGHRRAQRQGLAYVGAGSLVLAEALLFSLL
jgi:hypothetical protein